MLSRGRTPAIVAVALWAGCSGIPLPSDLERAQGLESQHRDDDALAAYSAIRAGCARPDARPHDDCGLAATREAQLLEHLARYPEAAAAWEALPSRTRDLRQAARGLVRAAEITIENLADPERGARIAWRCVERFPDEVPADDALALALRIGRTHDLRALLARIDRLVAQLHDEDIVDNLLFAGAELARDLDPQSGWKDAVARWDELARRFPRSPLRDDTLWRSAALLRAHHEADGARHRLQQILDTRRDALIAGSYNSILLDDAQLLIGQIYLDDLHDLPHAVEAFTQLADDYPASTLRDDGLFELARAHLAAHTPPSDGDRSAACAALARLRREYPDGNRVRVAKEKEGEIGCR